MSYISKRLAAVTMAAMLPVFAGVGQAVAQERLSIGTASTGSNPYVVGSVIAKEVSAGSGYIVGVQSTGGYNENLGLIGTGTIDVALNFLPDLVDAHLQQGKFEKAPGAEMFKNLRLLFPVYLATYHYFVREDSGIKTFEELKGRSFNVNVPSTATYGLNVKLIEALGYKMSDFKIMNLSGKDTFDALRNRITEASGTSVQIGGGPLLELSSSIPIRLLDIPDDAYARMDASFHNTLVRTTIPANTYPGQTTENHTYSVPAVLFVNASMPEEVAYTFTKAYWDNWDKLKADSRTLGDVDPQLAGVSRKLPFHPGAERYFREKGLLK